MVTETRQLTGPEFFRLEISQLETVLDQIEAAFADFRAGNRWLVQRVGPASVVVGVRGSFLDWDLDEACSRYRDRGWTSAKWERPGGGADVVLFTLGAEPSTDEAAEAESRILQSL